MSLARRMHEMWARPASAAAATDLGVTVDDAVIAEFARRGKVDATIEGRIVRLE